MFSELKKKKKKEGGAMDLEKANVENRRFEERQSKEKGK